MLINDSLKTDFYNIVVGDKSITSTLGEGKYYLKITDDETSESFYEYLSVEDLNNDYDEMLKFFKLYGSNDN